MEKMLEADKKCLEWQKAVFDQGMPGVEYNSFEPRAAYGERIREDGVVYVNDVCFGNEYPNSYLDIWYPDQNKKVKRPTIIYLHGGGFIFGDKVVGDPMAVGAGRDLDFCAAMTKRGFNAISANYCFAPEYRFPAQIKQIDQMLGYITRHAEELGLDTDRIFLGGGSAGAAISEIYGTVLTCPEYAEKLGITPSIRADQIKGLLIDEAPLSTAQYDDFMNALGCCWLGTDKIDEGLVGKLYTAAKWIKDKYLPSFINASNEDPCFLDSAQQLADVLEKNGTDHVLFYRDQSYGILKHGYMQLYETDENSKACFDAMMEFVDRQLAKK